MKKIVLLCLILIPVLLPAQEFEMRDTLRAAVVTGSRRSARETGALLTSREGMKSAASPLGEGDPVRWIQNLPGVAAGADGTSASYVRGGNLGGNLLTLDGIPVYGYSHVLGLTTVIPNEEIEAVSFAKGGFGGKQGNFTSSHIAVTTRPPGTDGVHTSMTVNKFLAGASVFGPISDRVSFTVSGRISPLGLEYAALKKRISAGLGGLDHFRAGVGDLYGKFLWQIAPERSLSAMALASADRYSFRTKDGTEQQFGWDNLIGAAQYLKEGAKGTSHIAISYNAYRSLQAMSNNYHGTENHFSLQSKREELTLTGEYASLLEGPFLFATGGQISYSAFSPGKVADVVNRKRTGMASAYLQANLETQRLDLSATVRPTVFRSDTTCFSADINIRGKWQFLPFLAVEATIDRMSQYYHTLEGLPVGWSMDLQIPVISRIPAETMMQGYAGLVATIGTHTLSAGVYAKQMDGLIYFKDARSLFNSSLASWENEVDLGKGDSKGVEVLYDYQGKDLYIQASATLSTSTRWGFVDVNDGKPFHSPFDRRLVGNVSVQWRGASVSFTYQDGNWVNGAGERYSVLSPSGEEVELLYFSSVNNYQMPALVRLDVGYRFQWQTKTISHGLSLGVYNVLNHFNPFTVYFDTKEENWKELALVPILPNISYRVSF